MAQSHEAALSGSERPARLTDFIQTHRAEIVAVWAEAVSALPIARELERPLLVDHIPDLLDRICEIAQHVGAGRDPESPLDLAELHAGERLEEGFDLGQVVTEYRMLRACILRLWARHVVAAEQLRDLQALDEAIDISIGASIDRFTRARDRTLRALDRIATEAFGSRSLDELLRRLLRVMQETTSAVDTTAILLREGNILRVRAAVGLGRETEENMTMEVGEGFAGAIAASGRPQTFNGHAHATIKSPLLRSAGLHTLYGVPLLEDSEVIGVAHMGSRTAHEFSKQDKRLFAALTARATSAIKQHMLNEEAVRASQEAREQAQKLRALADNIPQLDWMADETGARFWFNKQWYEYTGATFDDLKGWGWQAFHHPEHTPAADAKYRRAFATGQSWEDTYPLRGKDGCYRWFLGRAVPLRDVGIRWFGTNTDVTEQRLLGEVTSTLTSTLDYEELLTKVAKLAVPDLADWCVVDLVEREGVVRHVAIAHADPSKADAARRLKDEYSARMTAPAGVAQAIRAGDAVFGEDVEELLDRIAHDDRHLALLRELGLTSYVVAPLRVRDRTIGTITLATSGHARRFRESDVEVVKELARRTAIGLDNARLYREAQAATKLRENVLAIVSHELRTPLNTIDLAATMLLHGALEARSRKSVETIRRSTERMEKMIGDLLEMATIQSGRLTIESAEVVMRDLVNEVIDLYEPLALENGIKIIRDIEAANAKLFCDRIRIQQVFGNLIGNAKKFCRAGDVIFVRARIENKHAIFSVQDTGPGISPEDLPRIFEPYWSGERGKSKGTGLGLFISKAIVEAHGGTLSVVSKQDEGTTFSFTLAALTHARHAPEKVPA
jgi:PAS domain S-box-containing protein